MCDTVDLGFIEELNSVLTSNDFPSKVGGIPAWLELENLPEINELKCKQCDDPCVFLCQIYAPIEDKDECFHRILYVFICKNSNCCQTNSNKNLIILRSQLARSNRFYSFHPPNKNDKNKKIVPLIAICDICGCRGPSACAKCKTARYCGLVHQRIAWKYCGHKQNCGKETNTKVENTFLLPEFEIIIDAEENNENVSNKTDNDENDDDNDEETEQKCLKEFNDLAEQGKTGILDNVSDSELSSYITEGDEDKTFTQFKQKISKEPEQIIRYKRDGKPLWITDKEQLDNTLIPKCENCGSDRIFEFQIMPQLLNSLHDDNLDWGVLIVYTCRNSCDTNGKYNPEFIYKQDFAVTKE